MNTMETPPPSYQDVLNMATERIGSNLTPEKVLHVVSNLSVTESQVLANEEIDPHTIMQEIDRKAFDEGLNHYLTSEEATKRLNTKANEVTNACQMINTMFSNLAAKLGEIDSKNIGKAKFVPRFLELHEIYTDTLRKSTKLALSMAEYGIRFENKILRVILEPRIDYEKKKEYLNEYIKDAADFETDSADIQKSFERLEKDFLIFTVSFGSWAMGEDTTRSAEMESLVDEIKALQSQMDEIKGKMIGWGCGGAAGTVNATALLVVFLGPAALIAGLIAAGATVGFMIHWNNQRENLKKNKDEKQAKFDELKSEANSIVATRAQLMELGTRSFNLFAAELGKLNTVWTYARDDAIKVQIALESTKKDGKDMDNAVLREIMVMPNVGNASGLYNVMATYLNRYAEGVSKTL